MDYEFYDKIRKGNLQALRTIQKAELLGAPLWETKDYLFSLEKKALLLSVVAGEDTGDDTVTE